MFFFFCDFYARLEQSIILYIHVGATGATSSEGTSGEMAVSEPPQREGEEGERQREGEENRGEEMESQSGAAVSVVEATGGEELTTPMEEGPPSSTGSIQATGSGGGGGDETTTPLLTPHVQEQPQQESAATPVPSPGQSTHYCIK